MTTPPYNPPTKNSWMFSLTMFIAAFVIFLFNYFVTIDNDAIREGLASTPLPLVVLSAGWLLVATKLKGV